MKIDGLGTFTTESVLATAGPLATRVGQAAVAAFKIYALYNIYEGAFSNMLCLRTYRHGTDPLAAAKITLMGPNRGLAGMAGEARFYDETGKVSSWAARDQRHRRFYVVEDYNYTANRPECVGSWLSSLFTAKSYSLRSTVTSIFSYAPLPKSYRGFLITGSVTLLESCGELRLFGLLCPTVKFHLSPNQTDIQFSRDSGGGPGAMYTEDDISVFDIGMLGVIKNGLNTNVFTRINENRGQFVWGVAQLVMAVAFTAFFFPALVPGSSFVCAGYTFVASYPAIVAAIPLGLPVVHAILQF